MTVGDVALFVNPAGLADSQNKAAEDFRFIQDRLFQDLRLLRALGG